MTLVTKLPDPIHPEVCRECRGKGFHKMDCSRGSTVHPPECECAWCKGKLIRDAENRTLVVHLCHHGEVKSMCNMCQREREYYVREKDPKRNL